MPLRWPWTAALADLRKLAEENRRTLADIHSALESVSDATEALDSARLTLETLTIRLGVETKSISEVKNVLDASAKRVHNSLSNVAALESIGRGNEDRFVNS